MNEDEQYRCTVHIADSRGEVQGCGFIIDAAHVMTCKHVVDFCRDSAPPAPGEALHVVGQKEEASFRLVPVENAEDLPDEDVAILRLSDGECFHHDHVVARWEECRKGMQYSGGGVAEIEEDGATRLQRVQIGGMVGILDTRTRFMVDASGDDLRIEAGCSGAAVFNSAGEGGLIGMVAEYRQDRGGTIIRSCTLRDCWPAMIRCRDAGAPFVDMGLAPARAVNPIAALVAQEGQGAPVLVLPDIADTILLCDREEQTDPFRDRIRSFEKARRGALLTTIHGQLLDLPDRLSDRLTALGPQALVRKRQAGARKPLPQINIDMAKCAAADEGGIRSRIEYRMQDMLRAERPDVASFVKAIRKLGRPLAVEVRVTEAFVAESGAIAARAWSGIARDLSERDIGYPLFIFFIVERSGTSDGMDAMAGWSVEDQQFLVLNELKPVPVGDVRNWATSCYGEARAQGIMAHLAVRSEGRPELRLKELQDWLSGQ